MDNLNSKKEECYTDKSRVYKAKAKCKTLFDTADEMKELECAEISYQNGDNYFEAEHRKWMELESKLKAEGYTLVEVAALQEHYRKQIADVNAKIAATKKEWFLGESILREYEEASVRLEERQKQQEENKIMDRKKQPVR